MLFWPVMSGTGRNALRDVLVAGEAEEVAG